jgi:hypothetical protein
VRLNAQDELAECETLRYFGDEQQLPWVGCFIAYQEWYGVRVPTVGEASWLVDGQRQPHARFVVQALDYESLRPF